VFNLAPQHPVDVAGCLTTRPMKTPHRSGKGAVKYKCIMFYTTTKDTETGKKIAELMQRKKTAYEQVDEIAKKVGAHSWFEDGGGNFYAFQFKTPEREKPCEKTYKSKLEYMLSTLDGHGNHLHYKLWMSIPKRNTREGKAVNAMFSGVEKFSVFGAEANAIFNWNGRNKARRISWIIIYEKDDKYLISHPECDKGKEPNIPSDCQEITYSQTHWFLE
jgi:hypothetical protein